MSGQPAGLSINTGTGEITGTIANNASLGSVYTVTVTADDGISTPTNYQFSWTVTDPAPVAATIANQNDQDGDAGISVDASTTDPDGDTLSYGVSGQPAGLGINTGTGEITGTIDANASQGGTGGVYTVIVTADDGTTPTNYQFTWTVTDPTPPPPPPPSLLSDNFDDGDYTGWTVFDEGTRQAPSAWSAASGVMTQSSNIYASPTSSSSLPKLGTYAQFDGGTSWTDYRVSLTLRSTDNDDIGLMFRSQNSNNYYRFSWDKQRNYRRLVKNVNGVFTLLASDAMPYVQGQTYQLEITVQGTSIEARIDGVLVLSAVDGDLSTGTIALYSWGNTGSYFDDVFVEDLAVGGS